MNVEMTDGSVRDITDFEWQCEAKDNSGRHFSGYAEVIVDLSTDQDVHKDFRKVWKGNAIFDGDWGACFDSTTWESIVPLVYTGTLVVGDVSGIFEDPVKFKFSASEHLSVIQSALEKAIEEIPEIRVLCNKADEDTLTAELYNILISKNVDLSFMTGMSHRLDVDDFVRLNFEVIKAYLDQPFEYIFEIDKEPSLTLLTDGYGVLKK